MKILKYLLEVAKMRWDSVGLTVMLNA